MLQEALAADLHRAMQVARVRQEAEKDLPTLTKAELAELLFEVDASALQQRQVPHYTEISKFPGATRDLALVVKQAVPAQDLLDAFHAALQGHAQGKLVQAIVLFDEYRGKGLESDEKSLAFRFSLQDTQSTLQDDAVDAIMAALSQAAQQKHGAKLRA